ncbi:hypothetical protein FNV43_RR20774 [Rhamnella rubrinervis]|uniref:NB-ARC domain-containing protein n=1 Tax=Rhamnella rubrinervis TaxID=2594499 RepID=A0A8K0E0Y9_9ROSA|nr:hypothetical protein FNV43_RR20774 [Rhamnella rubrinervis]
MNATTTQLEVISPEVTRWVLEVDNIMNELRKKAKKNTEVVLKLQLERKFDRVSYPAPPTGMHFVPSMKAFYSRTKILKQVMEALNDENIHIIAIFGMGGIRKTTMGKEVARRAQEEKLFGAVVMAVVPQNPVETESGRAGELRRKIQETEKILLVLDDIWERLDLEVVSIPSPSEHPRCKILLTSRNEEVAHTQMRSQRTFIVEVLSENEAWNLLEVVVGPSINNHDLHPIAKQITNECKGLPIAIITVGRALENRGKDERNDALLQLRKSIARNISAEVGANVFSCIELSYRFLRSEEAKSCFLLCCLFPEDHDIPIETLVKFGKGLRLFEFIDSMEEARNKVRTLVQALKRCFLLLDSNKRECVKLHDVVRDVAISIASNKEHGFVVRCDNEIEEWPEIDTWENCTKTIVGVLLGLTRLEELYMRDSFSAWSPVQGNKEKICISLDELISLFDHLKFLVIHIPQVQLLGQTSVLFNNLTRSGIVISNDKWSGGNCLFGNYLVFEGDTKSMIECGIHVLLNKCERLELSIESLKIVSQLIEDGFLRLKVLKIKFCSDMEYLINLTSKCTRRPVPLALLEEMKIEFVDNLKGLCHPDLLHLQRDPTIQFQLFYNLTSLELRRCNKLQYVFSTSIARGSIPQLQSLSVESCEVEGIVYKETEENDDSNTVAADMIVFPKLAHVSFHWLDSLISLYRAMDGISAKLVPFKCTNWLPSLKGLYVASCHKLRVVFDFDKLLMETTNASLVAAQLIDPRDGSAPTPVRKHKPNQGNNTVRKKSQDQMVASTKSSHSDAQVEVRSAVARDGRVVRDWDGNDNYGTDKDKVLHNLESVTVEHCESVGVLFDFGEGQGPFPPVLNNLNQLSLYDLPGLMHIWNITKNGAHQLVVTSGFQNQTEIRVNGCGRLRCLFSPSIAKLLVMLRFIFVANCQSIEAVIGVAKGEKKKKKINKKRMLETSVRAARMSAEDTPMLKHVEDDGNVILDQNGLGDLNTNIHQSFQLKQKHVRKFEEAAKLRELQMEMERREILRPLWRQRIQIRQQEEESSKNSTP